MRRPRHPAPADRSPRHGLARVLSKLGLCSRREAETWIAAGRVSVAGRVVRDPERPVRPGDPLAVDGRPARSPERVYLALNKPRGLVTTAADERGRDTVYRCLEGAGLPWVAPVGRLDQASEGLLLFANDPAWAAAITDPESGPPKIYHVHVDRVPDAELPARLERGVVDAGETLAAARVVPLRSGGRTAWFEITLHEGRNRQIRRLLATQGLGVLRLVRVAIGPLALGTLAKGAWRHLTAEEVDALAPRSGAAGAD